MNAQEQVNSDQVSSNITKDEGKTTYVLMHNRKGIRIEYCLEKRRLELWISPLAGKSIDYKDRNFSNRDDHTTVFDKITFPDLEPKDFLECKYDPFHSILFFKNQKLHLLSIYDKPAVMVWFEGNGGRVDIKSDKQDEISQATSNLLVSIHPDRKKTFQFVAQLGKGAGAFIHKRDLDEGRSFFARAEIKKNQPIIFAAELLSENPLQAATNLAGIENLGNIITENEAKIDEALQFGAIKVRDNLDLQNIVEVNKRVLLSTQDESGAQRAAIKYIYYLIWHRDGGMTQAYNAYTGWVSPLEKWTEFQLKNPTQVGEGKQIEKFYGQLVNGKISKWEEDGLFFAVWSAFTHYTQTGSKKFVSPEYLTLMGQATQWMEKNFFQKEKGVFGRYHYCESPFTGSRGDGWDDAVGSMGDKGYTLFNGDTIVRAFDLYTNQIMYATYLMLSAMENSPKNSEYLQKAMALEVKLKAYYTTKNQVLPSYGELISSSKKSIIAPPYGMDECDYIWGLTLPLFYPEPSAMPTIHEQLLINQMKKPKGQFMASWFSVIAAMDPAIHSEVEMMKAMEYVIPQAVRPGKYLPMAYTIPEIVDVEDGNFYHDVRPQGFSAGAWFGALGNFGVRRLPYGIAVRGTQYLDKISQYVYKNTLINFQYQGKGENIFITLNGMILENTLQLPESLLNKKITEVKVTLNSDKKTNNDLWIGSTMSLKNINQQDKSLVFEVDCFGKNVAQLKNLSRKVSVYNLKGEKVKFEVKKYGLISYIEFQGTGAFKVQLD
ncbi:MAG: hypothetical protein EAZ07_08845 [Cytophagales bacterium]|nr:MAG: hypothetical protein EAZ07_08845 [Cytophagales bacterium]